MRLGLGMKMTGETDSKGAAVQGSPRIGLGHWSLYFLAKFVLAWQELIGLHALENLAFAAILVAPIGSRFLRAARSLAAVPVAISLLYHDSWLPPVSRVWSQAGLIGSFSMEYLAELAGRFIDWPVIALLALGLGAYAVAARFLRVGVIVLAVLSALTVYQRQDMTNGAAVAAVAAENGAARKGPATFDPDQRLRDFYNKEKQRVIKFPQVDSAVPFDIVLIHICSLSWDDLRAVGLDKAPLWRDMDFLFTHFNSAASYSGPAAIRVNRATCGQTSHQALYEPAAEDCYLMPALKRAGFATNFALNHDGHFDDFLTFVRQQRVDAPLQPFNGIPVALRAFDNSPVYDDEAVLGRWLESRRKTPAQQTALYYNTISLHDGNKMIAGQSARLSSHDSFGPRVAKLLNDLVGFMDKIRKDGRRAIVLVVPEHGAALRGDKFQIAGLREIPTPAITTVPVGVKIIGPGTTRTGPAATITDPTSYFGLMALLARLMGKPPFGDAGFDPLEYARDLPVTDHVAENESAIVLQRGQSYFLKQGTDGWRESQTGAR
jgi:cellulose synthase operon protein YhjU